MPCFMASATGSGNLRARLLRLYSFPIHSQIRVPAVVLAGHQPEVSAVSLTRCRAHSDARSGEGVRRPLNLGRLLQAGQVMNTSLLTSSVCAARIPTLSSQMGFYEGERTGCADGSRPCRARSAPRRDGCRSKETAQHCWRAGRCSLRRGSRAMGQSRPGRALPSAMSA